ncbi:MAG: O-antigen ligase family protein [Bacteroidia bacterium]
MLSQKIHRYLFLFGACSLAFGMMIGTVPTSVPQFLLLGNWLFEAGFKRKWFELRSNKLFWVLASVFLIHVAGFFYTSDLTAGWNDVRTKIPLMFLPLVFLTTKPLSRNEFHAVLYCFLLGSMVNLTWCYIYSFILHKNEIARSASRFMSHIRLGLYLNVAISCCVYFIFIHKDAAKRILFSGLILCFLFGMYFLGLASGFTNLIILGFCACCYMLTKQRILFKLISLLVLGACIFIVFRYVKGLHESQVLVKDTPYNKIQLKTKNGRFYSQIDTLSGQKENGNYVFINVNYEELKREWNKRCPEDSFTYAPKNNLIRYEVLLRYLTSRAYSKDSAGIWQLSHEDISNIKNNIPNYETTQWSYLHKRVYEIIYEYEEFKNGRNINGHSLTMRPYFWKAALTSIAQHPLTGVGTGDVQAELNKIYVDSHSPLTPRWYKRPHNQYLTITVALGITGLIIFFISLIWPLVKLKSKLPVLYYPFFILAATSFLLEDTLESQAGVTFYAFFNTFFISVAYYQLKEENGVKKPHTPGD